LDLDALQPPTDVLDAKRMTPEAEFLLASLRHEAPAPSPTLDWDKLLQLAQSHGVLPLFYRARNNQLPERFINHFRERWALSLFLTRELEELLHEFGRAGIEILPLKGPVLAELLYGHVSLRPSDDLDLLVRPEDFSRAESLLMKLGFEPIGPPDDYHRDFGRNGTYVELHFGVASPSAPNFDLPGAWMRARTLEFHGHTIRFLSPVDLILYLSLHGLKHRFARLIWVVDICRALESLDASHFSTLLDHASAQRIRNLVLTSCEIARRSLPVKLPPGAEIALRVEPALARTAAAMADGILDTVADPTTSVQDVGCYLQLADNPGQRWRQRLQFFLPTQQDYQWAARHHVPAKCAPLLRPFRLLLKYGPTPALRTLFPGSPDEE
jgi:Uncharacterised nucleotidyltransferase